MSCFKKIAYFDQVDKICPLDLLYFLKIIEREYNMVDQEILNSMCQLKEEIYNLGKGSKR